MTIIESPKNKIIKYINQLPSKKSSTHFIMEGEKYINDAPPHIEIESYVVSATFASNIDISRYAQDVYVVKDSLFKTISDTITPSGIMAICKKQAPSLQSLLAKKPSFVLVLEDLKDPGNLGTIIRTAEAANVDFIVLTKNSVDVYNRKVLRSTAGAIFYIPIVQNADIKDMASLKEAGFTLVSSSLCASQHHYDLDMTKNIAIVIGNEATGLSEKMFDITQQRVKIPMLGKSESLNASVAAGILIYEVLRQRV